MAGIDEKQIIKKILTETKTIAVVGISSGQKRPSNYVAQYLMEKDYNIIPVNPNLHAWEGKKCYPTLQSIPNSIRIDVVLVFRRSEYCAEIANDAVETNAKALWLQEGITSKEAEKIAIRHNLLFVMNRCMKKEHEKWKSGSDSQ